MAKEKARDREIRIVDRSAPRIAIQISEISLDPKTKTRRRLSVAHLTVTNLFGEEAKKIIIRQSKKQVDAKDAAAPEQRTHSTLAPVIVNNSASASNRVAKFACPLAGIGLNSWVSMVAEPSVLFIQKHANSWEYLLRTMSALITRLNIHPSFTAIPTTGSRETLFDKKGGGLGASLGTKRSFPWLGSWATTNFDAQAREHSAELQLCSKARLVRRRQSDLTLP